MNKFAVRLKRVTAFALSMMMILTGNFYNLSFSVYAAESGFTINGEEKDEYTFAYGTTLTGRHNGDALQTIVYQPDGSDSGSGIIEGFPEEIGTFYTFLYADNDDTKTVRITIEKDTLKAPADLTWVTAGETLTTAVAWSNPSTTEADLTTDGKISGLTISLYKNDEVVETHDIPSTDTSYDFSTDIAAHGYGSYSFTLTTNSSDSDHYNSSSTTDKCGSYQTADSAAPVITGDSFAFTNDLDGNGFLTAKAIDNESGIAGYAFSTTDITDVADAAFTATDASNSAAGVEHTYIAPVSESGSYNFFVKDNANVTKSSAAVTVAKVTYHNYYNGSVSTHQATVDRLYGTVTAESGLLTANRSGYVFDGWYDGQDASGNGTGSVITEIAAGTCADMDLYAKYTQSSLDVTVAPASGYDDLITSDGMVYSGAGELKATVTNPDGVAITYKWYKVTGDTYTAVGTDSNTLTVKNVSDSGDYLVRLVYDENDEHGYKDSAQVSVKITKNTLTVTPKLDASVTVYYNDLEPEGTASFDYDVTGFVGSDSKENVSITEGSYDTDYTQGDPVKNGYTITASGFTSDNYDFTYNPGTFEVYKKAVSDEDAKGVAIELSQEEGQPQDTYSYTGSNISPAVTVSDNGVVVSSDNYDVVFSDHLNAGADAIVTINFKNNYSGSLTKHFSIVKATPAIAVTFSETYEDEDGQNRTGFLYDTYSHAASFSISNNPGSGEVTYYFRAADAAKESATTTAPVNAGDYLVYAKIAETANYAAVTTDDLAYKITKRKLSITSESQTWVYDGNVHTNSNYTYDGIFASGDSFQYIEVKTEITDVGTKDNEITYALSGTTNPVNYDITLNPGTLEVTEQKLITAAHQEWDSSRPGTAAWIAVAKDHVDIAYKLQLYRVEDPSDIANGFTLIGSEVKTSETSYDFSDAIRSDSKANGVPENGYVYTLSVLPAGGAKAANYEESNSSLKSEAVRIYTTELTIDFDPVSIKDANFLPEGQSATKASQILIQGEQIKFKAVCNAGYDTPDCVIKNGSGVSGSMLQDKTGNGYAYVSAVVQPSTSAEVYITADDASPRLVKFTTDVSENDAPAKSAVVIEFEATDIVGLAGWTITTGSGMADMHELSNSALGSFEGENTTNGTSWKYTYTAVMDGANVAYYRLHGYFTVTKPGDYHFHVKDGGKSFSYYFWGHTEIRTEIDEETGEPKEVKYSIHEPISIYKIELNKGLAGGSDIVVNDGYPAHILKVSNKDEILPAIDGKLSADGFAFTNWLGTTGRYSNSGKYTANKNDTLTALWSDESYTYTVNYWYQNIGPDGLAAKDEAGKPAYVKDEEATDTFTAAYNTDIYSNTAAIQKPKVGYSLDSSDGHLEHINVKANGNVINVYYKRSSYTITFKYTDISGAEQILDTKSYVFGEKVEDYNNKPSVEGYTFIGWTYGESGKHPETMPENNITATGYFTPNDTSYIIDYYYQNIDDDNFSYISSETKYTYPTGNKVTIDGKPQDEYLPATHTNSIDLTKMTPEEIEGFTFYRRNAVNGNAAGAIPPAANKDSATISAIAGQTLHIAYYYTRNKYSITLNVYKGSRIDVGAKIYTKIFADIKYDTPLTPSDYEEFFKTDEEFTGSHPDSEFDGMYLIDICDWSTGDAPDNMPAGNISVNRDYVSSAIAPYDLEIWYEKDADNLGVYTKFGSTLGYYDNSGKILVAGAAGTPGVNLDTDVYRRAYRELLFYEFDHADYINSDGSASEGRILEVVNADDPKLIVKVYFKRPEVETKINYYYYASGMSETTKFATVTKTGAWGAYYDVQEELFNKSGLTLEGGVLNASGTPVELTQNGVLSSDAKFIDKETGKIATADTPDENKVPVEEFIGTLDKVTNYAETRYLKNGTDTNYSYTLIKEDPGSSNPMIKDAADGKYLSVFGATSSLVSGSTYTNYANVYYVNLSGDGLSNKLINVNYRTKYINETYGLKRPGDLYSEDRPDDYYKGAYEQANSDTGAQCTVELDGVRYKVRIAPGEQCATKSGSGKSAEWTPKTGYTQLSLSGINYNSTYNGLFNAYRTNDSSVEGENYVYITLPDRDGDEFIHYLHPGGHYSINTYTLLKDATVNGVPVMGDLIKCRADYRSLQQEKCNDEGLADDQRDRVWESVEIYSDSYNDSFSVIVNNDVVDSYTVYYYKEPARLHYTAVGNIYTKEYSYEYDAPVGGPAVNGFFGNREGFDLVWYLDANHTVPAGETFRIVHEDNYLYGQFEKKIYTGHHSIYYELPELIGGKRYLTEADIASLDEENAALVTKEETTDTVELETEFKDSNNLPIKKTIPINIVTYKYDGDPLLIVKEAPQLAFAEVATLDYNQYKDDYYGFAYDSTEVNQVRGYCQNAPVELAIHFKRDKFEILWDFNDKNAEGAKKTDDLKVEAGYNAILDHLKPAAVRNGYEFVKWLYTKTEDKQLIDPVPTHMPHYDITATAQWKPVAFDYTLFHFFQKNDQTYETDLVKSVAALGAESFTSVSFELDDKSKGSIDYAVVNGKKVGAYAVDSNATVYILGSVSGGKFIADSSDIIGIREDISKESSDAMVSEAKYFCKKYDVTAKSLWDFKMFDYAFTVHRIGGTIENLTVTDEANKLDQYTADVDMDLTLYYERTSGCKLNVITRIIDDPDESLGYKKGLTITGTGDYSYGLMANLTASVAPGFSFVGWYDKSDFEEHSDDLSQATPLSTSTSYSLIMKKSEDIVAVSKAKEVVEPLITVENLKENYTYGYGASPDNHITLKVDMSNITEDVSTYHVKGYQWYTVDEAGNKTEIPGAHAAIYNIPTGFNAGEYNYGCDVEIERYDNGRSITVYRQTDKTDDDTTNNPVVVNPAAMTVVPTGYEGIFDGAKHYGSIVVSDTAGPATKKVYMATVPLDADNYETAGTLFTDKYDDTKYESVLVDVGYRDVLPTKNADDTVKLDSNGNIEPAAQFVYYYIVDTTAEKNYAPAKGKIKILIKPKTVNVTPTAAVFKKVYDGTRNLTDEEVESFKELDKYFTLTGLVGDEDQSYTAHVTGNYDTAHVSTAAAITTNMDFIVSRADGSINYNYVINQSSKTTKFTGQIIPRPLDIEWYYALGDTTTPRDSDGRFVYVYDGSAKAPHPEIIESVGANRGVIAGDVLSVDVSAATKQKNTGMYDAVATVTVTSTTKASESSDYDFGDNGKCPYKIVVKQITLKLKDVTVTYDGNKHTPNELTDEVIAAIGRPVDKILFTTNKGYTDAGVYTDIQVANDSVKIFDESSNNVTSNYSFLYETSKLTINKKSVKVTAATITAEDKVYDGTTAATLDISGATLTGVEPGDVLSLDASKIKGAFEAKDVNDVDTPKTVNITYLDGALTGAAKDNYTLDTSASQQTTTAKITPVTLTVTPVGFDSIDYTYGSALPAAFSDVAVRTSTHVSVTGFILTEALGGKSTLIDGNVTFSGYVKDENSGTKTITVDVSGLTSTNNNYVFVAGEGCAFSVKKKKLTITTSAEKEKAYDGTTTAIGISSAEVVTGDLTLNGIESVDAGKVEISLESATQAFDSKNADTDDKHDKKATKIVVSGIKLSGDKAGNYELESASIDVTAKINKIELTVTAQDIADVPYGTNPLTATEGAKCDVTYTGFVTGDDADTLCGTLGFVSTGLTREFDPTVADKRKVGTYDYKPKGLESGNYTFSYVASTFTVIPKEITITPKDFNLAYKQVTEAGLKDGYDCTIEGWAYTDNYDDAIKAYLKGTADAYEESKYWTLLNESDRLNSPPIPGGYDIVIGNTSYSAATVKSYLDGAYTNYVFKFEKGKFNVGKLPLTVNVGASGLTIESKIYDGTTDILKEQLPLPAGFDAAALATILRSGDVEIPDAENAFSHFDLGKTLQENLEALGLKITGVYTDDKHVGTDKPVTLTFTLVQDSYFGLRYNFGTSDDTDITEKTVDTSADITPRDLHIKAQDLSVKYGEELPEVSAELLETEEGYDFVEGESFTSGSDLSGSATITTDYKSANASTKVGSYATTTPEALTSGGYTSSDYNITYYNGALTVSRNKLEVPANVIWDGENPGTLTWDSVAGIGDVDVAGYVLQLQKNDTPISIGSNGGYTSYDGAGKWMTVPATTTSYNFRDDIDNNHDGDKWAIYTIVIYAIPEGGADNTDLAGVEYSYSNPDSGNVRESDKVNTSTVASSEGKLAVACVKPKFKSDAVTDAGKYQVLINGKTEETLYSGETAVVTVELKEFLDDGVTKSWTGYEVTDSNWTDNNASNTSWGVTSTGTGEGQDMDPATGKGKYTATFTLKPTNQETVLEPEVSLTARPATLEAELHAIPHEGYNYEALGFDNGLTVGYGFSSAVAPFGQITAGPVSDNISADDYVYEYLDWKIRNVAGLEQFKNTDTTASQWGFPDKKGTENTKAGTYTYEVKVKATRKDNGESTTSAILYSENVKVTRASMAMTVSIADWTYGNTRSVPATSAEHPEGKSAVYWYKEDNLLSTWTTTMPTDAGDYKIKAKFGMSTNYDEIETPEADFTINRNKLATPVAADWSADTAKGVSYGKASFSISPVIYENNSAVSAASQVTPCYTVKLYKDGQCIKTLTNLTDTDATGISFTDDIFAAGAGEYYYTVQAHPNDALGQRNCADSDISESNRFRIAGYHNGSTSIIEKIYDGTYETAYESGVTTQGITLLAEEGHSAYKWYKNGVATDVTTSYYKVFNVSDTAEYFCEITKADGSKIYYLTTKAKILQRNITFTADSDTKAYDGTALTKNSYTITSGSLAEGDSVDSFTITGTQTVVGSSANTPSAFEIKRDISGVSTSENANYNITYANGTLTVNARSMTNNSDFVVADVPDFMYDATAHTPKPTVSDNGIYVPYAMIENVDFTYSYDNNVNAGTNTASVTVTGMGNYTGSITKTFTILKRPVEFVGESDTKTYNQASQSITGITHQITTGKTVGDLVSGHTYTGLNYEAKGKVVGEYDGQFSETLLIGMRIKSETGENVTDNYEITKTPGKLTIVASDAAFNVHLADCEVTYDGQEHAITNAPSATQLDDVTAADGTTTYTYSFNHEGVYTTDLSALTKVLAGTYTVYVKATNPNYTGTAETSATLTINRRPIEFKAESAIKEYTGSAITINDLIVGKPEGANEGGLVSGHTHNVVYEATGTIVGEYTGTITPDSSIIINSGLEDVTANYIITTVNGKLIITAALSEFTTVLEDDEYTYDATAHYIDKTPVAYDELGALALGTTTYSYSFSPDGPFVSDLSSLTKTDAGSYTVYVNATNPNYHHAAISSAKLVINKAEATTSVTYNPLRDLAAGSREYDGTAVDIADFVYPYSANTIVGATGKGEFTYSWYETDGINDVLLTAAPSKAGTYKVKVKYTEGDNFLETPEAECTFTILKKTTEDDYYKVSTTDYEGLHDGEYHTGTITIPANATVRFGESAEEASGAAGLTEIPTYDKIGEYTIYYYVTDPDYATPITGTITVKILPNEYNITYVDNLEMIDNPGMAVSNIPEGQTKTQEVDIVLASEVPVVKDSNGKIRYVFKEWNTKADGTGTAYNPEDIYAGDKPLTLYAIYREEISGNIAFDYNYIDPVDNVEKQAEQRITKVKVSLIQVIDGVETVVEVKDVDIAEPGANHISEINPYDFDVRDTLIDGKKVTYKIKVDKSDDGSDLNNYDEKIFGYKDRDFEFDYVPEVFELDWIITLDQLGITEATLPESIDVEVEYRETEDDTDSWHIITQHKNGGVTCIYDPATKTYRGKYMLWKWNSSKGMSYYHNIAVDSITVNGNTIELTDGCDYEFTSYVDEGITPAYFKPNDPIHAPLASGVAAGGINDDGVMTGVLRIKRYTIHYVADEKTKNCPEDDVKIIKQDKNLSPEIPKKAGCIFKGWSTSPDPKDPNAVIYMPGDVYDIDADITLYALFVSAGQGGGTTPKPDDGDTPSDNPSDKPSGGETVTPVDVIEDIIDSIIEIVVPTKPIYPGNPSEEIVGNEHEEVGDPTGPSEDQSLVVIIPSTGDDGAVEATVEVPDDVIESLLTPDEKKYKDEGEDVKLRLEVIEISNKKTEEEKKKIISTLKPDERLGSIFDVNLYLKVGKLAERMISDKDGTYAVKVKIPLLLRKYLENLSIMRFYEDENGNLITERIGSFIDGDEIGFDADTDSHYAFIYKVGRSYFILFNFLAMLAMIIITIIALLRRKKKDDEDEEEIEAIKNMYLARGEEYEEIEDEYKKDRRRRRVVSLIVTIISLIIYIIFFTWGKIIMFNWLSLYFAIALIIVILNFFIKGKDKDIKKREKKDREDLKAYLG